MTSDSGEVNQVPVIKTIHPLRRRLKVSAPEINSGGEGSEVVYNDDVANKTDVVVLPILEDNIDTKRSCVYGTVSFRGRRKEMEDTVSVKLGLVKTDGGQHGYDFFGVYDGHGGALVAEACKQRLHGIVEEEIRKLEGKEVEWERIMEKCFEKMNGEVMKERTMGSTAVVAVVGKEEVVVANCGDSRAVICRSGVALPLSVDHKPYRPDELKRIEAAGGKVINWNGHRVFGVLATSRSIGDEYLKPFIICKPEVTISKRTEEDAFLILASDGLWDVMSNEVACQVVKRCVNGRMRRRTQLAASKGRSDEAAAVLAKLAMARGSKDNISVIVVEL